ncbi:S8 family peptidase [Paenibacillus sp. MMS18-CY102]|uniref:S8 family peptidase n=1 Tax=Paenibacillus sp. MMS18-CY102 TaxID=2682849 RepID=UPI0013659820|nr:S8 family peptidase [Paenibacillus sp. MMS18-CY102]MWC28393.1 S8 family serine peptidase [Paenibacillus sp. MMS18-CY102]
MAKFRLEQLFGRSVRTSATKYTTRHLIGLRGDKSYARFIRYMNSKGIKPIKTIRRNRIVCCYLDARHLNSQVRIASRAAGIKYIEKDAKVRAHVLPAASARNRGRKNNESACPENATWNICRVQAPDAWKKTEGENVRVGIIDTGIAKHANLAIAGGVNTAGGSSYYDDNGHGTHVAGIVGATGSNGMQPGVAPKASLYAIKALDSEGLGYISDIIQGINWCVQNKIKVINMSFGLLPGEQSAALQEAIQKAYKKGIVIVASAGNSGTESGGIDEPASFDEAIAVAASTRNDEIASFSSRGDGIGLTAPGAQIRSTALDNGYQIMSGTSMACPHVTGGAALLLASDSSLTPEEVSSKLIAWAKTLSGYNRQAQGNGLMQLATIGAGASFVPSAPLVNKRANVFSRSQSVRRKAKRRVAGVKKKAK